MTERGFAASSVYLLYDADDALLYVGITIRNTRRLHEHARDKPWWGEVVRAEFRHTSTPFMARQLETKLIAELNPRHNIMRPPYVPPEVNPEAWEGRSRAPRFATHDEIEESRAMQAKRAAGRKT